MNQKVFFFLLFCLPAINLSAEKIYFTVIAKSGLSIRAEKSLSSERLAVVPFGEKVLPKTIFWEDKITVEEIEGFWISVEFGEVEGFMFSGFLLPGEIPASKKIEEDFIFMDYRYWDLDDEILILPFRDFNPKYFWYGAKFESEKIVFKEVEFSFYPDYSKNQKIYDYWRKYVNNGRFHGDFIPENILNFRERSDEIYDFFIGSKFQMNDDLPGTFFYDFKNKKTDFQFLRIDEVKNLKTGDFEFRLIGRKEESPSNNLGYLLDLEFEMKNKAKKINIIKGWENYPSELFEKYKNPSLAWYGDLNFDQIPDLLFCQNEMADKCGAFPWGEFYMSKIEGNEIKFEKASTNIGFSSFFLR